MTSVAKKILQDALALPTEERSALIEALSDSLDSTPVELSSEWSTEINDRIGQIERGEVEPVEWSTLEARIR